MMRGWPYTASSRDALGCTMYIPSNLKIFLGPRDVPRASPLGHLLVVQPNTPLLSAVYGFKKVLKISFLVIL